MNNIKIGFRLALGFAVVLALMLILTFLGLSRMTKIQDQLEDITGDNLVKVKLVTEMHDAVRTIAIAVRNVALLSEVSEMAPEIQRVAEQRERHQKNAARLAQIVESEKGKALLARIDEARIQTTSSIDKALELSKANNDAEAIKIILKEVRPWQNKWLDALNEMKQLQEKNTAESVEESRAAYQSARLLTWSLTIVAMFIGTLCAWLITRSVVRPLQEAVIIAKMVATGDLTSRIEVTSRDETGQLLQALRDMNHALVNIVNEVRSGTDTISSASQQIASGNADLSSRTESQASSLEETASSMEELTSTVKQNADNARQANQLAISASEVAVKGGAVVSEVVDTMGSINESAKKIVDIIGVIDGIAFQTNILALNAAVEAARAGEQGRGFAVVASEVRNLAQRSAQAAKEIKALIDTSVEKVDAGSKLVDQAGVTMQEVVESIKRVTDIMGEISAASAEQTSGIEQVQQAVAQIDETTQQNAALVEEAAAASESLREQAGKLTQVVSVFKLNSMQNTVPAKSEPNAASVTKKSVVPTATTPTNPLRVKRLARVETGNDWDEF